MLKRKAPKKAMPLDTPFRVKGYEYRGEVEYLLNASCPDLELLGLYMRVSPEEPWTLICSEKTCEGTCLVKTQCKYKILFSWKDKIEYDNPIVFIPEKKGTYSIQR